MIFWQSIFVSELKPISISSHLHTEEGEGFRSETAFPPKNNRVGSVGGRGENVFITNANSGTFHPCIHPHAKKPLFARGKQQ